MLELGNLKTNNKKKARKRVGRGNGSGWGKTSARGHNGQNSRSGGGVRPGFEGGQMPLFRRLPKRGFNNSVFATKYSTINVDLLDSFNDGDTVDLNLLVERGILKQVEKDGLKVLGAGEINKKLTVIANKFTQSAVEKIEKAGGKAQVI